MTATEDRVLEAMLAHHAELLDGVAQRVTTLSSLADSRRGAAGGDGHEPAAVELVAYVNDHVLPHARAEEHTIYRAAAAREELAATVEKMIEEHLLLAASAELLAEAVDAQAAASEAEAFGTLFAIHVAKENELLLPVLAADEEVSLAELLAEMRRLLESPTLDVRDLPPAERHEQIFATYGALEPGTAFVLVNDHDPKPLRYQFEAEHAGDFTWDYLESGPRTWRVRIGRARAA